MGNDIQDTDAETKQETMVREAVAEAKKEIYFNVFGWLVTIAIVTSTAFAVFNYVVAVREESRADKAAAEVYMQERQPEYCEDMEYDIAECLSLKIGVNGWRQVMVKHADGEIYMVGSATGPNGAYEDTHVTLQQDEDAYYLQQW